MDSKILKVGGGVLNFRLSGFLTSWQSLDHSASLGPHQGSADSRHGAIGQSSGTGTDPVSAQVHSSVTK